jgi:glycine cleavage system H protein
MNSAVQTDLFATKGIEYIVVIGFLALLTVAWHLIRAPANSEGADRGTRLDWRSVLRGVGLPETDFLFHPGHAWARLSRDDDVAVVGWDDFARRLVDPADGFQLPAPGTRLKAGVPGWTIGAGGRELKMLAPVDGEVQAVNAAVLEDPTLASRDPYGNGWLVQVRIPSSEPVRRNLLAGRLARSWSELTERALQGIAAEAPDAALGAVLADGGEPSEGLARALAPDSWEEVVQRFFLLDPELDAGSSTEEA